MQGTSLRKSLDRNDDLGVRLILGDFGWPFPLDDVEDLLALW